MTKIDTTKSLDELSEHSWGDPPESATFTSRARYEARKTKLESLTIEHIAQLISIDFEDDNLILIPFGLAKIEGQSHCLAYEQLDLLVHILKQHAYPWKDNTAVYQQMNTVFNEWLDTLYEAENTAEQTDDSNEYYRASYQITHRENALLRARLDLELSIN